MRELFRSILFALCFAFSGGCARNAPPISAPPIINWSDFSDAGLIQWQLAAGRKLGRLPVVFACHSGPDDSGQWVSSPSIDVPKVPVAAVACLLHAAYPNVPVVLIACNAGHARLFVPNVFYPDNIVWTRPGRDWRAEWNEWGIGHFDEFLEGKEKPHEQKTH